MKQRIDRVLSSPETTWGFVTLGFAIRLLLLAQVGHDPLIGDPASYDEMARSYLSGSLNPLWAPGVPLYLCLVRSIGINSALLLRLAMLPFYAGCSYFTYRTALLLAGKRSVGNLCLLLLAISPASVIASVEPMTELPSAMCLLLIAYYLMRVELPATLAEMLLIGITIGYFVLLRPSTLLLLAFVPLCFLWHGRRVQTAVVLLSGLLVVGAWVGYVHQQTGYYRINTGNTKNLFYGNNPRTPVYRTWWLASHKQLPGLDEPPATVSGQISREAEFLALAKTHMRQHPELFLLRSFNRACTYFAFNVFAASWVIQNYAFPKGIGLTIAALDASIYVITVFLSILYVGTLPSTGPRPRAALVLFGLILLYAFPYFLAFSHPRMHYPLEPLFMILSSAFAVDLLHGGAQLEQTLQKRRIAISLALVSFGLIQFEFLWLAGIRTLNG